MVSHDAAAALVVCRCHRNFIWPRHACQGPHRIALTPFEHDRFLDLADFLPSSLSFNRDFLHRWKMEDFFPSRIGVCQLCLFCCCSDSPAVHCRHCDPYNDSVGCMGLTAYRRKVDQRFLASSQFWTILRNHGGTFWIVFLLWSHCCCWFFSLVDCHRYDACAHRWNSSR